MIEGFLSASRAAGSRVAGPDPGLAVPGISDGTDDRTESPAVHRPRMTRRLPALVLALMIPVACDADDDPSGPSACFPVPLDATLRSGGGGGGGGGWPEQGTSLQGGPGGGGGIPDQGTGLQRSPRPGMETQGRYLGLADLDGVRLEVAATGAAVTLQGDQLMAEGYPDSASLRGVELDATTRDIRHLTVRIESVESVDRVDRLALSIEGAEVCDDGDHGVFVGGRWDETGEHIAADGALTYACASGVITKCVTWGYAPWIVGVDLHQACTRLARADYCGTGTPWTLDGTTIDVYDPNGIQTVTPDARFHFEAAWGVEGAVCVNQTRYDVEDGEGRKVTPECFAGLPACTGLDDAAAATALLANRSQHTPIDACE